MSVRPARPADLMRLIALMQEGHARSLYRDQGGIDTGYARKILARSIQQHGGTHFGAAFLVVAHEGEEITGYYWGFLNKVYEIGDKLCATEVHTYLSPRAHRGDFILMLRTFLDWAKSIPEVIEVLIGKTPIIEDDDGRYDALLRRKGFSDFGRIYRLQIARTAKAEAA